MVLRYLFIRLGYNLYIIAVWCIALLRCFEGLFYVSPVSVKGRSFRLSSERESTLRQILQDPLLRFSQWSQAVSQLLEASADVTEFSHIALLVQNIEVKLIFFPKFNRVPRPIIIPNIMCSLILEEQG